MERKMKRQEESPVAAKAKAEVILESRMPESQKREYLQMIAPVEQAEAEKIPFEVYVRVKKVPKHLHKAMLVFPKAKGVRTASLQAWDEIFKDF